MQQQLIDKEGRPVVGQRIWVGQQALQGDGGSLVDDVSRRSGPVVIRLVQTAKLGDQASTNGARARRRSLGKLARDMGLVRVELDIGKVSL